ncbi:glycoside hydrolase family 127 protein [candidate division KSB1 bacterium]|nr:glycoside hydrolase family 127 protein [candidate division KSB1 bacterium]RQW11486.1 MAG: glycoside hydrolase family 127 protein [candidate division KSB1 bacterium]
MRKMKIMLILLPFLLSAGELQHPQNIVLGGELAQRVQLLQKRFMHQPFDLDLIVQDVARAPEQKRRFEEYEGDVSGRILGSWSYISRLLGERPQKLEDIFAAVLEHQKDGYFGEDQKKIGWDYWGRQTFGHGRLLGGLVQYYLYSKDERALEAAIKLANYFIRNIPTWTSTHEENPWTNEDDWVVWRDEKADRQHFVKTHMTSILESLMMLYDIDPKQDYLKAGNSIVELFPDFGHYHSHSYMNTMTGMAMLYNRTGDQSVFNRLHDLYWQEIMRRGYAMDGGMREWFPDDHRTEGCSITDWIRLNLYLWDVSQEAVYLDEAENAWYNALNFHQTANGAFGHAVCTPQGYDDEYSEAWWCCTMHGLWAYADLLNFSLVAEGDELWFNFYAPLSAEVNDVGFSIATDYPQDGQISIQCTRAGKTTVTTHLRIPSWANDIDVQLNGADVTGHYARGIFSFQHHWKQGDKLDIDIPLFLRLVDARGNDLLKRRELDHLYTASFYYGALLLGADTKYNQNAPDEIYYSASKDYRIDGQEAPFVLAKAHFMIPAATNNFLSSTLLVPISEATGYMEWTDDWRNFMRNGEKPICRNAVQIFHKVKIEK